MLRCDPPDPDGAMGKAAAVPQAVGEQRKNKWALEYGTPPPPRSKKLRAAYFAGAYYVVTSVVELLRIIWLHDYSAWLGRDITAILGIILSAITAALATVVFLVSWAVAPAWVKKSVLASRDGPRPGA